MTGWGMPLPSFGVGVIADGAALEAEAALALIGGKAAMRAGWDDAFDAVDGVVLVEAGRVAPDRLAEALPRIVELAERGCPVVVAIERDQIDAVAAALLGHGPALLVEPSVADRAVALLAARRAGAPAGVREGEREELGRLHDEIARIADMLTRLGAESVGRSSVVADRSLAYRPRQAEPPVDPQIVRAAIRARRLRDGFFAAGLFEDPAWDMLLDLFAAELEDAPVSVSSLCIAAAVAPTTALRWIARMTDGGLLARRPDPGDRRRAFIVLTPAASAGMHGYAAALARAELGFA